ncbi:o-succinylbenzoate synthase [Metabacillus arenae]|uniref:o-succinylbenzoate synthase n=1 Tax=Metabacillus arenae TaxID=2771434 RepID=A0A926NLK2_9BACI|nr:o-succinylbenzoate synthase [Metabacillus arenae]MBD1380262.1 o-succinylbenzoate synthase [Metabacillus arenae]
MIRIQKVVLHHLSLKLKTPFESSLETVTDRESIIVEAEDQRGVVGYGEVVAFSSPWYTEETIQTCYHLLKDFLIPLVFGNSFEHPSEVQKVFKRLKRNQMAKSAIEGAIWDIYAKKQETSLALQLGGSRKEIDAGVVVGISNQKTMLNQIETYLADGYKRIKIKIKPSQDLSIVREIRKHFPNLPLMADANSSYKLTDINRLKELDQYNLLMIEQPLAADDIVDHRLLQSQIETPICLDESIVTFEDAKKAIELGSCKVINIKPGRVGGLTESIKIHDYCMDHAIPVWVGGMLESGVSRAHNIALASLENFSIPGDLSASTRYWEEDIILPEVEVRNGKIKVPIDMPGIGFGLNEQAIKKFTTKIDQFNK